MVADLSNYTIHIDSSFNGTRMFVFGARNAGGDVVVLVRGPNKNYIVRKKESYGGIWVNSARMKFYGVPDFYAIASSKPLEEMAPSALYRQLGIGSAQLLSAPPRLVTKDSFEGFQEAFLRAKTREKLFSNVMEPVNFMAETLFKTTIEFPDSIPQGNYTAEIYLISDGELVGSQAIPIRVMKAGLDAWIAQVAHEQPVWYGLAAVFMALGAGALAARVFEKI